MPMKRVTLILFHVMNLKRLVKHLFAILTRYYDQTICISINNVTGVNGNPVDDDAFIHRDRFELPFA